MVEYRSDTKGGRAVDPLRCPRIRETFLKPIQKRRRLILYGSEVYQVARVL